MADAIAQDQSVSLNTLCNQSLDKLNDLNEDNKRHQDIVKKGLQAEITSIQDMHNGFWGTLASFMTLGVSSLITNLCHAYQINSLRNKIQKVNNKQIKGYREHRKFYDAMEDLKDRVQNGNKWYKSDRFKNFENLINTSPILDDNTRKEMQGVLQQAKADNKRIQNNQIQSNLLRTANANRWSQYGNYAEKRLNSLIEVAKNSLNKETNEENRVLCNALAGLNDEGNQNQKDAVMNLLSKPNTFDSFDDLKQALANNIDSIDIDNNKLINYYTVPKDQEENGALTVTQSTPKNEGKDNAKKPSVSCSSVTSTRPSHVYEDDSDLIKRSHDSLL